MEVVKGIIIIIMVCFIAMIVFFINDTPSERTFYHQLTIDTHGVDTYYLTIESNRGTETQTIVNEVFTKTLPHGEYNLEACYWNVNNTKKCEGQRIWLDEDVTIDFFIGVIE